MQKLLEHTKNKLVEMGICKKKDIICEDIRILKYCNVIFTHDMQSHRSVVLEYLKSLGIISCGRFGEWDYLWSNQSFLSGQNAVKQVLDSENYRI